MLYFMPERQFYAKRFSAWPGWTPARGGVEVPGQAASLLAKTAPALQHHSSLRSGSMDMPIFLKIFISYPSWTTDMQCCLRETSEVSRGKQDILFRLLYCLSAFIGYHGCFTPLDFIFASQKQTVLGFQKLFSAG
jgi:hypothetical protein